MPFENEHSARLIEPEKFQQDTFKRQEVDEGIDIIIGKLEGEDAMTTQSYRFKSDKFTAELARKWMQGNNIDYILFEEAKEKQSPTEDNKIYMMPIIGVLGEQFTVQDLLIHLNKAKDCGIIKLLIDSPGGYVDKGEKMVNELNKSGKIIHATNIGDVCSMAVDLFMTATVRTFNPTKGAFLIHNPWGGQEGEAKDFEDAAQELRDIEDRMAKKLSKQLNVDVNIIKGFMNENTPLTKDQIKELGFAKIIGETKIKAVAYFKSKNNNMSEIKLNEEQSKQLSGLETKMSSFGKLLDKIFGQVKAKALVKQDVNGTELDFGDEVQTEEQIAIGVKATVDGQPAVGDYILEDGRTLVFEAGELIDIKQPEDDEMEALKKELEALKVENEALKAEKETMDKATEALKAENESAISKLEEVNAKTESIKTEFVAFKSQFTEFKAQVNTPSSDDKEDHKSGFTYKGIKN